MNKTRVIAVDIYGTVLCEDDPEHDMPPRRGFAEFVNTAKSRGIKLVAAYEADLRRLKTDINETFLGRTGFGAEIFNGFYELSMRPKKYGRILEDLLIQREELMIIGDDRELDLSGAPINCSLVIVPPYRGITDKFNFMSIPIP